MKLAYGFFAQAAENLPDGRFFAFGGGIDTLVMPHYPAVVPMLALVVRLQVDPEELDSEHSFRMRITDCSGNAVSPDFHHTFRPVAPAQPDRPGIYALALTITGLELPAADEYRFHLHVDDEEIGTLRLFADQASVSDSSDKS